MKVFIKYFFLGIASQALVAAAFLLLGSLSNSKAHPIRFFFRLYEPFGVLAATIMPGRGESHMITSGFISIPMGIIFYSVVLGFVAWFFKRRQTR